MIKEYLAKRNIDSQLTEEGIYYVMDNQSDGPQPKEGDAVKVHYTGKFLDGRKFDSSRDREMPFVFVIGQQQVIPGWELGLQLFSVGQKGTIYLPPELAYGPNGAGDTIPPNASLAFEIELLDILDEEAYKLHQEEEEKRQIEAVEAFIQHQMGVDIPLIKDWVRERKLLMRNTESGLHYIIEKEGSGAQPQAGQKVTVHYTGKLLNGQVFDSSHSRNEPISFTLGVGQVIPGWDEGIGLFREGGKGTIVIPSVMGYGPRDMGAIPANSILHFDIELIKIG